MKVSNLDDAVAQYRANGFEVEYGREKRPINALIYFADGTYFELIWKIGVPSWARIACKLFGKKAFASRTRNWNKASQGLIGLTLHSDPDNFENTKKLLTDSGQSYFQFTSERLDTKGRDLRFVGVMPDNANIPFFGSCNTNFEREGFVHPNGALGFKSLAFGTTMDLLPMVNAICDDDRVNFFIGEGVEDLEFAYAQTEQRVKKLANRNLPD